MANTGPLKCACCGDRFPREQIVKAPTGQVYMGHVHQRLKQLQEKKRKQERREYRAATKVRKADHLPTQLENTRKKFNAFIIALDIALGHGCACCPNNRTPLSALRAQGKAIHAGHFLSVGHAPHLRFLPLNVWGQLGGCNLKAEKSKGDAQRMEDNYRTLLVERVGLEAVEWLEGPHPRADYTCHELKELRRVVDKEKRHLLAGNPPTRDWRAIRDWREIISAIKPENRARYPKDWKLRSRFVRFYRAKNRCEWCNAENYQPHPVTGSKVVLTTAHVHDHRPEAASLLNLAALCQRCHNRHDAKMRQRNRKARSKP